MTGRAGRALAAAGLVAVVAAAGVVAAPANADPGAPWAVKAQQRLNDLGCDAGPDDGIVGEHTQSAVIRFQSRVRLQQTGRLNHDTKTMLYSEGAKRCDQRPVPANSDSGRRIVISQRQNWLWLINKHGTVVAQEGMVDNTAVLGTGHNRVGSYCGRSARIKLNTDGGGLWLHNFVRFASCGVGFHRIPMYMSNNQQIHAAWRLGTDMRESHGCIRLSKHMSHVVWKFARVGTSVVVVRG